MENPVVASELELAVKQDLAVDLDSDGAASTPAASASYLRDEASFKEQVWSKEFIEATTWFSSMILASQFFIGSFNDQMEIKVGTSATVKLVIFFNAFMAGGFFLASLSGKAIDKFGFGVVALVTTVLGFTINVLMVCGNNTALQYFIVVLFTVQRASLYTFYFSKVGHDLGFRFFGSLCGGGFFISAVFTLLQYGFLELGLQTNSFVLSNSILAVLGVVSLAYPARILKEESG